MASVESNITAGTRSRLRRRAKTPPTIVPAVPAAPVDGAKGAAPTLEGEEKDRQFITALARGLDILRAFESSPAMGNQDLAAKTGLPKATVSRLTYTLTRLGYLAVAADGDKYQLGAAVLSLGMAFLRNTSMTDVLRPFMQDLADATKGTVALASRDDMACVYLALCRGVSHIILPQDVGSRLPFEQTALGMAMLAVMPDEERTPMIERLRAEVGEEAWPRLSRMIDRCQREVEEDGFCVCAGTWYEDINACAAPLQLPNGNQVLAINLGGPSFWMSESALRDDIGPQLVNVMKNMEELGIIRRPRVPRRNGRTG